MTRDRKTAEKHAAAEHFLQFCEARYGTDRGDGGKELDLKEMDILKAAHHMAGFELIHSHIRL